MLLTIVLAVMRLPYQQGGPWYRCKVGQMYAGMFLYVLYVFAWGLDLNSFPFLVRDCIRVNLDQDSNLAKMGS